MRGINVRTVLKAGWKSASSQPKTMTRTMEGTTEPKTRTAAVGTRGEGGMGKLKK